MSDHTARKTAVWSAAVGALTWLFVVFDVPGPIRGVLALAFVVAVPGTCLLLAGGVRDVATVCLLGPALSLGLGSLLSTLLMLLNAWSTLLATSMLAAASLAAVWYMHRGAYVPSLNRLRRPVAGEVE